ncbi:MAG: cation diffusion facilitator family transporter [Atopobiaceae bacterium]|nr:cation diffusion facilitator family transporter [Atopobiaceae bacterium]
MESRSDRIIRASAVNIAGNLLLSAFKLAIGLISNSIAITVDAVNNTTDALSSIVAIGGAKLAQRHPNNKHPFGYGRMEYISSIAISAIIISAGITSAIEAVQAIVDPPEPDYKPVTLALVALACAVKVG